MPSRSRCLPVDPDNPDPSVLAEAVALLREGELVAFPTETLYALGADATNPDAVARVFTVKGRSPDSPLTLLLADTAMVSTVVTMIPPIASTLMARFFPGPLTLILQASPSLPPALTAWGGTIGVRVSRLPLAQALPREAQVPLTGTSANISGAESPTSGEEVLQQLTGRIPLILDGGRVPLGIPSTILDLTVSPPRLLREGALSKQELCTLMASHGIPLSE